MAYAPEPIALTQSDTNPSAWEPKPLVVVGPLVATSVAAVDVTDLDVAIAAYLEGLTGYDVAEVQTLKNDEGVLSWVTDAP